jgi:hypothetical protein
MTKVPGSASKLGLKALYALSLLALCIYVVEVPATAVPFINGPTISCTQSWGSITSGTGTGSVNPGAFRVIDPYHLNLENVTVSCDADSTVFCGAYLGFAFSGAGYFVDQLNFVVQLTGTSTDAEARGSVTVNSTSSSSWSVSGGALVMDPLYFSVSPDPDYGSFWVSGEFLIDSLAPGTQIQWGATSLDFAATAAPEPSSALVLLAGLAWVGFLRRKCRR